MLLDAGFTLTFYDGDRIAAHAARAGVSVDPAVVNRTEQALRTEIQERPGSPLRTHDDGGKSWLHLVFRRILELAGASGPPDTLERAADAVFREHMKHNVWRRVGPGVPEALARLRDAGLSLGVVSNSEGTIEAMLEDVGLRPFFGAILDSTVVGVAKPDSRIFELALERLGVSASEAIMVGDSPTGDITGASNAGIPAALLDPFGFYPWVEAPRFRDVAAFTDALLR